MDSIDSRFVYPDNLAKEHRDKYKARFTSLCEDMVAFIKFAGFEKMVMVDELCLGFALVDYFEDIERLKEFHPVGHVNGIKVVAYTSYWLLRRKPIQLRQTADKNVIDVNERFVFTYIMNFLSHVDGSENEEDSILSRSNKGLHAFSESLLYFLKYRPLSAVTIELFITSFLAGRIYQSSEKDLSGLLGIY